MTFDAWVISRLRAHGAYAGVLDDAPGRAMIKALIAFQKDVGLKVTGTANEATVEALRRPASVRDVVQLQVKPPAEPVWMRDARRYMGLKEIAGPKSNSTILGWAKTLGGWIASFFTDDDIPWCGLFVGAVIATTLPSELLPKNPLGALEWNKFGVPLAKPALGAILTFKRPGGGHVGFYAGEDSTHYHVLGGNQSNSVSITRIEKSRLQAIRWPRTADAPVGGPVKLTASGVPVSTNEA